MRGLIRTSVRRALLPIINQMSAAGIITLPGIMTGQILAGMDPLEAAKYQILLMFLLSGGSGLAAVAVVYLAAMRLTDDRQRLRIDRLTAKSKGTAPMIAADVMTRNVISVAAGRDDRGRGRADAGARHLRAAGGGRRAARCAAS